MYTYNPEGRRITKEVDGVVTKYFYDGGQVIVEYDGYDRIMRKFIYGPGIDEPVKMIAQYPKADVDDDGDVDIEDIREMAVAWLAEDGELEYDAAADLDFDGKITNNDLDILAENWGTNGEREEKVYYYYFDGLGSVMALSDSTGQTVERYRYDVYGRYEILGPLDSQKREQSSFANPYYFTARRLDTETSLYYYRARYYKPEIGRFLQTDPVGYEDGMNLYAYVGNNPIIFIDPMGSVNQMQTRVFGLDSRINQNNLAVWNSMQEKEAEIISAAVEEFQATIDEGMHSIEGFFNMLEYKANMSLYNGLQQASHLSSVGPVTVYIPRFGQYQVDFGFIGTAAGAIDSVFGDEILSHAENAFDRWQKHKYYKWEYGQMQWNGLLSPITRKQQNTNVTSGSSFLSNPNVSTLNYNYSSSLGSSFK